MEAEMMDKPNELRKRANRPETPARHALRDCLDSTGYDASRPPHAPELRCDRFSTCWTSSTGPARAAAARRDDRAGRSRFPSRSTACWCTQRHDLHACPLYGEPIALRVLDRKLGADSICRHIVLETAGTGGRSNTARCACTCRC